MLLTALVAAHHLEQARLRDRVGLSAALHDQRRDDREGERDLDLDVRALADAAVHVDRTADALDVGLHDVHAHAASGDVRDALRRGEARDEDQSEHLAVGHARELFGGREVAVERALLDGGRVDADAVVDDLDVDHPAFVERAQRERALLGLSAAQLGALDAVVDGVAHEVGERVLDRLDDALVELGVPALEHEPHALARHALHVAHDAREAVPDVPDRLHARLHHGFLELGGHERQALRRRDERGLGLLRGELGNLIAREHELADQVHESVEQTDVDADLVLREQSGIDAASVAPVAVSTAGAVRQHFLRLLARSRELEPRDHGADVEVALAARRRDLGEQAPDRVDHREQRVGGLGVDQQRAVAREREQRLARVRDGLDLRQIQEAAAALDRVDVAEQAADQLGRRGIALELEQRALEALEVLAALGLELRDDEIALFARGGRAHALFRWASR